MEKRFLWVYLFVFIDVLGFSIILPLLPYYAEEFEASPSIVGLLLSSNAFAQMICTPFIGKLSDIYGRRRILLLCISGTVISFFILGNATTLAELFFSRFLDGVLGGNISLAQAYIADVTNEQERSKSFGFIGMGILFLASYHKAFGFGFIFGPALGGTLAVYGYRVPAYVSCTVSLFNLFGVLMFLPESLPSDQRSSQTINPSLWTIYRALSVPVLGSLLLLRFFYSFSFTLFETCFGFFNLHTLSLDPRSSSYVLAYVGLIYSLVQGGGMRVLTKRFSEGQIIGGALGGFSLSLLLWLSSSSLFSLLLCLFPVAVSAGILNTLLSSQISKNVQRCDLGGTLGLSAAMGSLSRVVAPLTSGVLIDRLGIWAPGVMGAILMGVAALTWAHGNLSPPIKKRE